jgi:hypothetical protein
MVAQANIVVGVLLVINFCVQYLTDAGLDYRRHHRATVLDPIPSPPTMRVAEPYQFYAAPAPTKIFDTAPAPAPAQLLLPYIGHRANFLTTIQSDLRVGFFLSLLYDKNSYK